MGLSPFAPRRPWRRRTVKRVVSTAMLGVTTAHQGTLEGHMQKICFYANREMGKRSGNGARMAGNEC
ncbi:hypothetical protein PSAC2689_110197 [Paraburkholderia sacchari]